MGDSPSVVYALQRTRDDPSRPGWGGRFVPVWDDRKTIFERNTTIDDKVEAFGVVEFALPIPAGMTRAHSARVMFDNRVPVVAANDGRVLRFRFSPRDAKVWSYVIRSDYAAVRRNGWAIHRSNACARANQAPVSAERSCRTSRHAWIAAKRQCRRGETPPRSDRVDRTIHDQSDPAGDL